MEGYIQQKVRAVSNSLWNSTHQEWLFPQNEVKRKHFPENVPPLEHFSRQLPIRSQVIRHKDHSSDLSVLQRRSWLFRVIVSSFLPAATSISRTCDGLFFLLLLFTSFACLLGCGSKLFFVGSLFTAFRSHMEPSENPWFWKSYS